MGQAHFPEHIRLQVSHEGVEFRHTVREGSAGGKCNPLPAGQFVHVTAFRKHIGRFLCVCSGHACHRSHLGINVKVFKILRLVYKEAVHAQFLKGDGMIFCFPGGQLGEFSFQLFP